MEFTVDIQMPALAERPDAGEIHDWILERMKAAGYVEPVLLVVNPS